MGYGRPNLSWSVKTALDLGRVSNLPTVWTNTLAGVILAGVSPADWRMLVLLLAMTLAYTGGMFLNDAFDAAIDAEERPERPIPSGRVSASSVFKSGYGMLLLAVILIALIAFGNNGGGTIALLSAAALAGSIVLYNAWHKDNPLSPFVMGMCRMLVYVSAALAMTPTPSAAVFTGAVVLLAYLIGLTYTAKQENLGTVKNLWPLLLLATPLVYGIALLSADTDAAIHSSSAPIITMLIFFTAWLVFALRYVFRRQPGDIPKAVGSMIAGISLIDAIFIATTGYFLLALMAVAACFMTIVLQRWVAGT